MNIETTVAALIDLVLAEDSDSYQEAKIKLTSLRNSVAVQTRDPEHELRKIFVQMGTPDHLIGFEYLVKAVLMVYEDRKWIDNVTYGLYPRLAENFGSTASKAERAIRHAVEVTWGRGDWALLNEYFGNIVSPDKGKPINSEFIARMANVLRIRVKTG